MTTRVEFYSLLRDLIGAPELELPLPEGATVDVLLHELYSRHPKLRAWDGRLLFAADLDYVERSHAIKPGEVISLMPPVQGG
jgi:molybdopterin converting factor small subunit